MTGGRNIYSPMILGCPRCQGFALPFLCPRKTEASAAQHASNKQHQGVAPKLPHGSRAEMGPDGSHSRLKGIVGFHMILGGIIHSMISGAFFGPHIYIYILPVLGEWTSSIYKRLFPPSCEEVQEHVDLAQKKDDHYSTRPISDS